MTWTVHHGRSELVLPGLGPYGACVTDPPYGLSFMNRDWDRPDNIAFRAAFWACVYGSLKPGAYLVAFGGTRKFHRLMCAIEDAGFEIRDTLCWLYGQGMPKSHDVSKALDKAAGVEPVAIEPASGCGIMKPDGDWNTTRNRHVMPAPATDAAKQWDGYGTALSPSWEPIVLARKPLFGTVAANVLEHGVGALNIDGCRLAGGKRVPGSLSKPETQGYGTWKGARTTDSGHDPNVGRWPPNVACDEAAAGMVDEQSGERASGQGDGTGGSKSGGIWSPSTGKPAGPQYGDAGGASRFFLRANWSDSELLFCRAKSMFDAWQKDLVSIVENPSSPRREHVASALDRAVSLASQGAIQSSGWRGLSTVGTLSALRQACVSAIATTLTFGSGPSQQQRLGEPTQSSSLASGAATSGQTDITTTTTSQQKSDGSAVSATFRRTQNNMDRGARVSLSDSRLCYCPKASTAERNRGLGDEQNTHPTVKPVALMRWLVRLVTPPGETVLDPFTGSGSTGIAAVLEGRSFVGIEEAAEAVRIAKLRIHHVQANPDEVADVAPAKARQPELFG